MKIACAKFPVTDYVGAWMGDYNGFQGGRRAHFAFQRSAGAQLGVVRSVFCGERIQYSPEVLVQVCRFEGRDGCDACSNEIV